MGEDRHHRPRNAGPPALQRSVRESSITALSIESTSNRSRCTSAKNHQFPERRGWDSNPRGGLTPPTRFPIALLKPLGHLSGFPQGIGALAAATGEEVAQQRCALRFAHAPDDFGAVVQGRLAKDVEDAAG